MATSMLCADDSQIRIPRSRLKQMLLASRTEVDLVLGDTEIGDCIEALRGMGVSGRLLTDTLGYQPPARYRWLSDNFAERERLYLTIRAFYHKVKAAIEEQN